MRGLHDRDNTSQFGYALLRRSDAAHAAGLGQAVCAQSFISKLYSRFKARTSTEDANDSKVKLCFSLSNGDLEIKSRRMHKFLRLPADAGATVHGVSKPVA